MNDQEMEFDFEPEQPAPKGKKVRVSVDMSPQDVLSLDAEGADIYFEDDPGKFLDLPPEVEKQLSSLTRTRFLVACGVHARLKQQAAHPELFKTPGIEVKGRLASATSRLEVRGKQPGMHYCWKRPDELRQAGYDGYVVADETDLDTFGSRVGSTPTVGTHGDTELVLMKIPQETADARQRAVAEKSQHRAENVEASTAEDIRRSGGKPLRVEGKDVRNWS